MKIAMATRNGSRAQPKRKLARDLTVATWVSLVVAIVAYLLTKFVFFNMLPDKWFGDSAKLLDIASGGMEGAGSYAATANVFAIFPVWSLDLIVVTIGCIFLFLCFNSVRNWKGLIALWILLVPMMPQVLLVPNKETIVVSMTLVIFALSSRLSRERNLYFAIVGIYLLYGGLVRPYYLIIGLIWTLLVLWRRMSILQRVAVIMLGTMAMCLMPKEVFIFLQGQRDLSNHWGLYIAMSDNRTAFFNPVDPDSLPHFIYNYVYAALMLNLPIAALTSPKETLLVISVFIVGWLVCTGIWRGSMRSRLMALLFLSHLLVLWIFEPDLGSYFRHFSSVLAYLLPALRMMGIPRPLHRPSSPSVAKPLPLTEART